MKLPFDLPPNQLPVIVPRPKIISRTLADGTVLHEAHNIRHLNLPSDRGLYDIGFMLNFLQFSKKSTPEEFTIRALQRRLTFSDKLTFPQLRDTGKPVFVEGSNAKLVWAMIPATVIVTSKFTALDLHDQCMALREPEALRETIEHVFQGCPDADVDEVLKRFLSFTPPHRTDISRALKMLLSLGIVGKYIRVDKRTYRAVFNMRMVAATRSGILRGMIAAEDLLHRVDGTRVAFSVDLNAAEPPVKRIKSTRTGKRRKLTRAEYQSKYHIEREKLTKAEKLIADYESKGCLTPEQFIVLRRAQDDPEIPFQMREALTCVFETSRTDPMTEIPTAAAAASKERKRRG